MKEILPTHFEFKDWEKCFQLCRYISSLEKHEIQLVISNHWATEGYWIELKGTPIGNLDSVYTGFEEISALEKRVIQHVSEETKGLML